MVYDTPQEMLEAKNNKQRLTDELISALIAQEMADGAGSNSIYEFMDATGLNGKDAIKYLVDVFDYYSPYLKQKAKQYAELDDDELQKEIDAWNEEAWDEDDYDFSDGYDGYEYFDLDDEDEHFDWENSINGLPADHSHMTADVDGDGNSDIEGIDVDKDGDMDIVKVKDGKGKNKSLEAKDTLLSEIDSTGTVNKKDSDDWNTISETLSDYSF